ncbi:hypothetical protein KUF71_018442 [Frankliniella fusca]|uniref:Uncharacterized protein n=1 Tax=Frankliniella fusca TaxID=407009 RepID=A0AAE1L5M5_9NEOP|nr:hypothetical protein KUF71_018442 [Frankliniella fusca]
MRKWGRLGRPDLP